MICDVVGSTLKPNTTYAAGVLCGTVQYIISILPVAYHRYASVVLLFRAIRLLALRNDTI